MRALLISAPKTVMGFDRLVRLPNLGLTSIAANIDKKLCEVKVLDLHLIKKNVESYLQNVINTFKPDLIGLSCMVFQYKTAVETARFIRKHYPDIKLVLGGYFATVDYENIVQSEEMQLFDFIIYGEGEQPFNELLKVMKNSGDYSHVPSLVYKDEGTIKINARCELMNLDTMKLPDRDARWIKNGYHILGIPADVIETSRGCVYDCNFCSIREMYGKSFRKFSTERVIADIKDAKAHGAKALFIIDDNITLDGRRYKKLCEEIIRNGLHDISYTIQASVKGLKLVPDLIETMAKAGTIGVFLGIENALDENLTGMQKANQFETSEAEEVAAKLKKHGIMIVGGFILGHPDDTREILIANFEFAKKIGVDIPLFNILTPHLKTEIREELIAGGFVTNLTDYSKYNHYCANVKTKYLSSDELFNLRNRLDQRFPFESGAVFRFIRKYPKFIAKMVWERSFIEPRNMIKFLQGILPFN